MNFKDIVLKRYATKMFDGKKIPKSKLNEILDIIRYSPSSSNLQPWKLKIIADIETKKLLEPFSYNQKQITTCSHLLVFCADIDLEKKCDKLIKIWPNAKEYYSGLKNMFINMSREEKISFAQRQLYIALVFGILGAKSLGIDSCPMEGFMPNKYKEILKLPENLVPSVLLTIGYAADNPRKKYRFSKKDIII